VKDPIHYPTNGQQFYLIILKAMKSRELKKKNKRLNYFKGDEANIRPHKSNYETSKAVQNLTIYEFKT